MRGIPVLYTDSHYAVVAPHELDVLLQGERLKAFRRASGWVIVGHDPIRGRGGDYAGSERRMQQRRQCVRCGDSIVLNDKMQKLRSCLTCINLVDGKCQGKSFPG